ncbi:hypothetical protein UFOVP350_28 [uncultured Caudovirales phage]|uniref:Uncharacterized protein n=1 Tax=uncultured Caudovirales phage TaxID=2100421 RepID=A0A6J5M0T3_9CAUD|nr:hypothetical protein UFOVP350_28 [uncultured Caudovirales phage]
MKAADARRLREEALTRQLSDVYELIEHLSNNGKSKLEYSGKVTEQMACRLIRDGYNVAILDEHSLTWIQW